MGLHIVPTLIGTIVYRIFNFWLPIIPALILRPQTEQHLPHKPIPGKRSGLCGVAGKLGILERYGVGTDGSGGPGQVKVPGHPVIPWERVVRVEAQVVVRD